MNARRILLLAGCVSAVVWGLVCWLSHGIGDSSGFHYETGNDGMPTVWWLALHFVAGAVLIGCWRGLRRAKREVRDQDRVSTGWWIVGFAVLFRVILLPSVPIHESDFYRYLWDGQSSAAGVNPYEFEPGALFLYEEGVVEWFRDRDVAGVIWRGREFSPEEQSRLEALKELRDADPVVLARVGHQAVPTIYPPVAQAVFWLSVICFGASLMGLKVMLLVFEVGILWLIYRLLRRFQLPIEGLLIYAWNPLVLKEFANSAHYDAVPIFFTLLAVWLAVRGEKGESQWQAGRDRGAALASAAALAGGTLAKFFSVLLLPLLILPRWRNWLGYSIFGVLLVVAYLPFLLWDDAGIGKVFAGLGIYNANWQYRAFLFPIVKGLLSLVMEEGTAWMTAKYVVAALLMGVVAWLSVLRQARSPLQTVGHCGAVVAALFLLSPTAFPWYFCWLLPFLCLFPRWPWILLSLMLPLNYLDFHSIESIPLAHAYFLGYPLLSWVVWGTFVGALGIERWRRRGSSTEAGDGPALQ